MSSTDIKGEDKRVSVEVRDSPTTSIENDLDYVAPVDTAYLASTGFSKFYRSVLFQMVLFGA